MQLTHSLILAHSSLMHALEPGDHSASGTKSSPPRRKLRFLSVRGEVRRRRCMREGGLVDECSSGSWRSLVLVLLLLLSHLGCSSSLRHRRGVSGRGVAVRSAALTPPPLLLLPPPSLPLSALLFVLHLLLGLAMLTARRGLSRRPALRWLLRPLLALSPCLLLHLIFSRRRREVSAPTSAHQVVCTQRGRERDGISEQAGGGGMG